MPMLHLPCHFALGVLLLTATAALAQDTPPTTRPAVELIEPVGPDAVRAADLRLDGFEALVWDDPYEPRQRVMARATHADATAVHVFDGPAGVHTLTPAALGAGDGRGRLTLHLNATKLLDLAPDRVFLGHRLTPDVLPEPVNVVGGHDTSAGPSGRVCPTDAAAELHGPPLPLGRRGTRPRPPHQHRHRPAP